MWIGSSKGHVDWEDVSDLEGLAGSGFKDLKQLDAMHTHGEHHAPFPSPPLHL